MGYPQQELEKRVTDGKKVLAEERASIYGSKMIKRVPRELLENIGVVFQNIIDAHKFDIAEVTQPPLDCDKFLSKKHIIPATARASFIEDRFEQHPQFAHLQGFFMSLLDLYSGNNEKSPYRANDLNEALRWAAAKKDPTPYLIVGRQTNFQGVNDQHGHEYCDLLFDRLTQDIRDVIRKEQQAGRVAPETGMFLFEVHKIVTKNMVAILTQTDDPDALTRLIDKINLRIAERVKSEGLEDIQHPLHPHKKGVGFVFGAQEVPRDLWHEGLIEKFKSDIKDQAKVTEDNNLKFDPVAAFGDRKPRKTDNAKPDRNVPKPD